MCVDIVQVDISSGGLLLCTNIHVGKAPLLVWNVWSGWTVMVDTFRKSCSDSLAFTATKNCIIDCSTSCLMYCLASIGTLTEAAVNGANCCIL